MRRNWRQGSLLGGNSDSLEETDGPEAGEKRAASVSLQSGQ